VWCDGVIGELSAGDETLADKLANAIGYNRTERTFISGGLIVSGAADDTAHALAQLLPEHDIDSVSAVCDRQDAGLSLVSVNNLVDVLGHTRSIEKKSHIGIF